MVIEQKKTHIAYRCPACSAAATGFVGSFSLKADMLKLKCPCNESELSFTPCGTQDDKKVRLSVPCIFCRKDHNYVVSQKVFFDSDIFLLNCPYTKQDICIIGKEDEVSKEIERSDKELNALFAECGVDSLDDIKHKDEEETELTDPRIYDIVRFLVSELRDEGAIHCPCEGGNYDFDFVNEGVRIFCRDCGAQFVFACASVSAAEDFLKTDRIDLKD